MGIFCSCNSEIQLLRRRFKLYQAADTGNLKTVKKIIYRYPNCYSYEAMAYAAQSGHFDIVQFMYTHKHHSDIEVNYTIIQAIYRGNHEIIQYLINHRGGLQFAVTYDMFRVALQMQVNDVLEILFNCSYNEHVRIQTLYYAIRIGDVKSMDRLLDDNKEEIYECLQHAAMFNKSQTIEHLIKKGKFELVNALNTAVRYENIIIIKTLIKYGAIPDRITLFRSTMCYNKEVIKLLLNSYTWDRSSELQLLNCSIYFCRRLVVLNTTILQVYEILINLKFMCDDTVRHIFSFFNILIYDRLRR